MQVCTNTVEPYAHAPQVLRVPRKNECTEWDLNPRVRTHCDLNTTPWTARASVHDICLDVCVISLLLDHKNKAAIACFVAAMLEYTLYSKKHNLPKTSLIALSATS